MHMSDRLVEIAQRYDREARKCARAGAWLAATVMQASALEAGLQAMCFLYPVEVKRTRVFAKKRFRGKRAKALELGLEQLIELASEAGWIPAQRFRWAGKRATIGQFCHELRKVRNRVHPGRWARDRPVPLKFSKGVYAVIEEIFDAARSWLLHRVKRDLQRAMEREQRKAALQHKAAQRHAGARLAAAAAPGVT